jgi:Recombinase
VRLAFTKYAEGIYRDLDIAKMLNAAGYRSRGKRASIPFQKDTVRDMLRKVFYTGQVSYKGELFPGRHPAIVSHELWDKCQAVRRAYALQPLAPRANTRTYPLAGLIHCAECKRPHRGTELRQMRFHHAPDRQHDGHCGQPATLPAVIMEDKAAEALMQIKLPDEWQTAILDNTKAGADPKTTERKRARIAQKTKRA